jgi:hypothetical protein
MVFSPLVNVIEHAVLDRIYINYVWCGAFEGDRGSRDADSSQAGSHGGIAGLAL